MKERHGMSISVAASSVLPTSWTIVFDDACPLVHKLSWLIRQWDRDGVFSYVGRGSGDNKNTALLERLKETSWSLMLVDQDGQAWHGPEAIPFILKNLPSGKIAAVTYTIPGTMWLTRKLYFMVSRNRQYFNDETSTAKTDCLRA